MKIKNRVFAVLTVLALAASLIGCSKTETAEPESSKTNEQAAESTSAAAVSPAASSAASSSEAEPAKSGESSKTLVLYFSRTGEQYGVGVIEKGNTAIVADMITEELGADEFEVVPADDHYPTTYKELTDVAKQEQSDKARPAYQGSLPDLSGYDTIFIGAPVWWGDWPMILYTVFESNDFSGKTLVPFCTHAGSGLSGFDKKLQSACPGAEVLQGLAVTGTDAQNAQDSVRQSVQEWLTELGYE